MSLSPSKSTISPQSTNSECSKKNQPVGGYLRAIFGKDMKAQKVHKNDTQTSLTTHASTSSTSTENNPESSWSDSKFVEMAKKKGWSAPTSTRPSLGI